MAINNLTHQAVQRAAHRAAAIIQQAGRSFTMFSIPRGGVPAGYALEAALLRCDVRVTHVAFAEDADIIVDDLYDSGTTMSAYADFDAIRVVLFSKVDDPAFNCVVGSFLSPGDWVVFPWEGTEAHSAEDIPRRLLQYIGEDVERGGLRETPARFLKAWKEYSRGYTMDAASILKVFEDGAEKVDEMVLVKSIPVYSHCEHHLAPFFGTAHIAYIPNGRIVGLSKLSRLVDMFSKRLQVQERLTNQIADALEEHLKPLGVGVVVECRHMCMESRGIQRTGSSTVTSAMRGVMRTEHSARAELLSLVNRR